ncbi:MAG: biotin--[acetyl-CoA-carboxylase] ligase [Acidobacteriota bacterium]|nr:biotin--[acetyl-CoA-carboxylase] ligase [Acidobacteriota bacterium]
MSLFSELCGAVRTDRTLGDTIVAREVDSTNLLARRLVDELAAMGESCRSLSVFAVEQTAGRGRLGRDWSSLAGLGVYVSLLRCLPRRRLEWLPMAVPVALVECLREHFSCAAAIKWPNDVLVGGKKLGGVLIESAMVDGATAAIIGFGLNHGHRPDQMPTPLATSLRQEIESLPALGEVATALARAVTERVARSGDSALVADYRHLSVHTPGDRVQCRIARATLEGAFVGFDDLGHLRLEVAGEEQIIASGEIVE